MIEMRLLLQTDWEAENMTDVVKQAVRQFKWKGNKVEVQYSSLFGIRMMNKNEMVFFTPIGTVEFVKAFAEKIGVKLPDPIHATELLKLEGRWYSEGLLRNEFQSKNKYPFPIFVKPLIELKKFTGFVAKSDKDFDLYPEVDWSTTKLFCTQVLENIVSEWRCYVLNGKVFACVNYSGDPLRFPYAHVIEELIEKVSNPPIAYSLDVAVVEVNYQYFTHFIEINDAFSLGYYGGDVELYTKMLDLRWKEIIKTQ